MKRKKTYRNYWDTIKRNSLCITGVQEEEEEKKRIEILFKAIMAKNFPDLERDLDIQVHEANPSPQNFNPK